MAKSIITRQAQTRQEYGLKPLDGLMMIGAFNARYGYYNLANGRPLTRGSAAVLRTAAPGVVAQQTAVNQGAWCPVAIPSINAKYVAVWHGVFAGAIVGGSPKLVGISNTTSSQSLDVIGITRETNDNITVTCRLASTNATRTFTVGASGWYGKAVTLVGFYEISTLTVQLLVYVDGQITRYSSSLSFGADTAPTILGTEQFCVGTDVIENPTRSPNVQTALAACFCGSIPTNKLSEIAVNPWQIFQPRRRVTFFDLGAGGATAVNNDLAASYLIRAAASADVEAYYALRAAASADTSPSYTIRAAVAAELAAAYSVTGSVAADSAASYNIHAAVTAESAAAYNLRAAVQSDLASAYTVRESVSADLAGAYDIQTAGSVASSSTAEYAIRGAVSSDLPAAYNLHAAVAADSQALYALRAAVSADSSASYDIEAGVASVYADLFASYAVDGIAIADPPARYTITAAARAREVVASARSYQVTK